jgi:urease alpha subunit
MGDPNASIPTPQPVKMRPMFGATSSNKHSFAFVSKAAADNGVKNLYGLNKEVEGVTGCHQASTCSEILFFLKFLLAVTRYIRKAWL